MKRDIKKGKSSNKISECNTIFKDTYLLYKYNIGIDYHHIKNRDEERHTKMDKGWIIKVMNIIQYLRTLTSYTSTIVQYRYRELHYIMKWDIQKKKNGVIKVVVNVIRQFMTLTCYISTI